MEARELNARGAADWPRNRILRALPQDEIDMVLPQLSATAVGRGHVLYESGEAIQHVYFPLTGTYSLIAETSHGESADVAVIGNEGFVGLPVFLGTERIPVRAVGQVPGIVLGMTDDAFRDVLRRDGVLERMLMRYTQMRMVEMGQTILCNRLHDVEQRTARWLLQLGERVGQARFELTQEFFATMLGTTRPTVTVAAQSLRDDGLISYGRGVIELIDRDGLEAASCECYRIVRDELDRLLDQGPT